MSQHLALYRSFRPLTFSDVVAQRQVVVPLRQSVIRGDIGHAYLFTGTRGTGKTSLAKIFARAVNCLNPRNGDPCNECEVCRGILDGSILDIMEIDAASNNSVDNIRRITEEIVYLPARTKYKVYIIDEVHMLSQGAFNALLKTLEEPPEHAIFILATTEPHRIPATIMSRCQRYDFRRIAVPEIVDRLRYIADEEKINITDDALKTLANLADGALRDAVSLLDQVRSGIEGEITRADIIRMIGLVDDAFLEQMATAMLSRNPARLIALVNDLMMSGRDLIRFVMDLSRYFRNLLVYKTSRGADELLFLSDRTLAGLKRLAPPADVPVIIDIIEQLGVLQNNLKFNPDVRTGLEVGLIGISWKLPQVLPENACDHLQDDAASDFSTEPRENAFPEKSSLGKADTPDIPEQAESDSASATEAEAVTDAADSEEAAADRTVEPASAIDAEPETDSTENAIDESAQTDKAEAPLSPEPTKAIPKRAAPRPQTSQLLKGNRPKADPVDQPSGRTVREPEDAPELTFPSFRDEPEEAEAIEPEPAFNAPSLDELMRSSVADTDQARDDVAAGAETKSPEPPEPTENPAETEMAARDIGTDMETETASAGEKASDVTETTAIEEPAPEKADTATADVPPADYEYREVWRQVLLKLRNDLRVDLQMLLASAEVSCANGLWTIRYPKDQKAHCDAVGKEANVTYLEGILRELGAPAKVEVVREDQNLTFNVNPDEAPWMKKVREAAKKLNIPTEMED